MNNELRYKLFGQTFGQSFHPSCVSRFEFLNIFAEHGCHLNHHLDDKNDGRKGYAFGASYSYLIQRKKDNLLYCVNFIMCTRNVCGAFMAELDEIK